MGTNHTSSETTPMLGVREYEERYNVELCTLPPDDNHGLSAPRLVIRAFNQARYDCTSVDLYDLIAWLRAHRPELLREEGNS